MGRIVANAAELRSAISVVAESTGQAEATFAAVERKLQSALSAAKSEAEQARIARELEAFRQKAQAALKQIGVNARRTNEAFSKRLSLVTEKRG